MNLQDIALSKWIEFTDSIKELTDSGILLSEQPATHRREVLLTQNHVEKAFAWATFFEIDAEYVNDVLEQYNAFMALFEGEIDISIDFIKLSDITFGQFIDSKMMTANSDISTWRQMQYVMVIYETVNYKPEYLDEESGEFKAFGTVFLDSVIAYMRWFESLNNTINETYTVFQEIGIDEGDHMKEHMRRWGWINFLKSIAKTKVYDIPGSGLNSIDCSRAANMDDVLVWASEEKEYNVALSLDMESKS